MPNPHRPARLFPLVALIAAIALPMASQSTSAQTGPSLMLKPWADDKQIEIANSNHIQENSGNQAIRLYDVTARAQLTPDDQHKLTIGFDMTYLTVFKSGRFVDQSVALGMRLGEWEGWTIDAIAGIGYAGNNPYDDSTAIYGKGNLIATRQLSEKSSLTVLLDYNRNRTVFPDIPLPGFAWTHRPNEQWFYSLGFPVNQIVWRPMENLVLEVRHAMLINFEADVRYYFNKDLSVFAKFESRAEGFFIDGQSSRRRTFFTQRSAELGVDWKPTDFVQLSLAGGYAFDQELETGWDLRDTNSTDLKDQPYIRAGIELSF